MADQARNSGATMTMVGVWNLEGLFRTDGNFSPDDKAYKAYKAEPNPFATAITRASVNVLAVEEVGDRDASADLAGLGPGRQGTATSSVPPWATTRGI